MILLPPTSPLFPYTTLFRSASRPEIEVDGQLSPYRSLRDFIAKLEADGELIRVREPVSTVLEMTEIQTRLLAEGGPAVLFEKDRKSTRLNSSHTVISYAVFC